MIWYVPKSQMQCSARIYTEKYWNYTRKDQWEWSEEKCKTGYEKFEELYHRCKVVDGHRLW